MTVSAVALVTDVVRDGAAIVGYGFNSNGRYAQGCLLRERFIKRLLDTSPTELLDSSGSNLDPERAWAIMMRNEKPGGHGERSVAVGVLDMAIWDAAAKIEGVPLFRLVAKRNGRTPASRVFVYAAGGYYTSEPDVQALKEEVRKYTDQGFTVVKMKIGGDSLSADLRRIEAALSALPTGCQLAVDANGRFDLDLALRYARELAHYNLYWYEEPGDPLDYDLIATVAREYGGAIATGENLFSCQDARNLVRYGGLRPTLDWLQMDCALSYGLVEYQRTLRMLHDHGWSASRCIPHGGHQMSLNIAAGLGLGGNETYPGLFQPFGGFADGTTVQGGYVEMPDLPGIGFEGKSKLYSLLKSIHQ